MEFDSAFTDEPDFPEGWPIIDHDEVLLGEWLDGKKPSSVAARRYLVQLVRFLRTDLPKHGPETRRKYWRWIVEAHREGVAEAVRYEGVVAPIRAKALPDFLLWQAQAKGGVQ
jgi:hypothetical protein